mgnify:CR=1 FL=1
MATLAIIGLASKVMKYKEDNYVKLQMVIAYIIVYRGRGEGGMSQTTDMASRKFG